MKAGFGLDAKKTDEICSFLNRVLANTYALYVNTLNCHWNLEDSRFFFLHKMLEEQYRQLAENGDELAERMRQMGNKVTASLKHFAKNCQVEDVDEKMSADEMLDALAIGHEKAILELRALSQLAEDNKDFGLVDLLGGILRDHEKTVWFLRSHL